MVSGRVGRWVSQCPHIASAHLCRSASVAVVEGCRRPRPPSGKEEAGGGAGSWHGHRPGADDPPPFRPFPPSGSGVSRGVRGGIRGREVGAWLPVAKERRPNSAREPLHFVGIQKVRPRSDPCHLASQPPGVRFCGRSWGRRLGRAVRAERAGGTSRRQDTRGRFRSAPRCSERLAKCSQGGSEF